MKSVLEQVSSDSSPKYPYLGVSSDEEVILFLSPETGVMVHSNRRHDPYTYETSWAEELFKPLHGSVTLTNP
jgi:hypothetical protein